MNYPNIDLKLTGKNIKRLISESKYSVKQIQEYLHLSCPQPIYRWFQGKMLPSIDHAYALSQLLRVHMEELLIPKFENECVCNISDIKNAQTRRIQTYYVGLRRVV